MKIIRWAAVAVTVLMSLMNVGLVFGSDDDIPVAVVVLAVGLGLLGFAAAAGLGARTAWGRPAVLGIGALNLVGAVIALIVGGEGAAIGLVVSALILVLGFLSPDADVSRRPAGAWPA